MGYQEGRHQEDYEGDTGGRGFLILGGDTDVICESLKNSNQDRHREYLKIGVQDLHPKFESSCKQ